MADYDYIILGGGTAGCVLANRLSEDTSSRVLLVEAGGPARGFFNDMPAGAFMLLGQAKSDWSYAVRPDESIGGRSVIWPAGRMLGGSSGLNGMVYVRGQRSDYDHWVAAGAQGWSFDEVLPYFAKSESFHGAPSSVRGTLGPVHVSPQHEIHPLAQAFIDACQANGMPERLTYCEGDVGGAFLVDGTQYRGRRAGSRVSYLDPARGRPNLDVITGATVDRVAIEQGRAAAVEILSGGERRRIGARREVIVSAGTFGSPAILQRSGIGKASELSALGIGIVRDLPAVGANLQDHTGISLLKFVDVPTYNSEMGPLALVRHLANYLLYRNGQLTSLAVQAMAFSVSTLGNASDPDLVFGFMPMAMDMQGKEPKPHKRAGITLLSHIARPRGRGRITLQSADPTNRPLIDFRLLDNDEDVAVLIQAGRMLDRLSDSQPLKRHVTGGEAGIPTEHSSDAEWIDYLRARSVTGLHAVGTCAMGGSNAVLDPALKVRGIDGLRVVDASAMPNIISGNTQSVVYMIAEKAADLIRKG